MTLPIPTEIIDDDRLIQALREVFGKSVTFDMEKEIKRAAKALYPELTDAQRNYARMADDAFCPACGKRGISTCNCEE